MKHVKNQKKSLEKLRGIFFQLGLIVACGLTLVAFEWTTPVYLSELPAPDVEVEGDYVYIPNTYSEVPKKPEVKLEPKKIDPTKINIVKNIVEPIDPTPTDPIVDPNPTFDPKWITVEPTKPEPAPLPFAEHMPEFKGGDEGLFRFLKDNLKYPAFAKENGIKGKVFVQFVVGKNGKIRDVKILRGVNKLLDKEAIRVVKEMPEWTPGRQNGKNVSVIYNLPINFVLR